MTEQELFRIGNMYFGFGEDKRWDSLAELLECGTHRRMEPNYTAAIVFGRAMAKYIDNLSVRGEDELHKGG